MHYYPWTCWTRNGRQDGRLSVVTPAQGEVVPIADAKLHLRVDHDDEDDYIEGLVEAATAEIDSPRGWLGRSLLTKTLRLTLDSYPPHTVYLPGVPVQSVTKVEYRDRNGGFQELPPEDYETDLTAEPALLWPARDGSLCRGSWPTDMATGPDVFRVEYEAGYGETSADVPRLIRQWLLTRVGDMYRDREGTVLGTIQAQLTHVERALDNMRVR